MNRIINTVILAVGIFLIGNWLWATPYPSGGGTDPTPSLTETVAGIVEIGSGDDFVSGGTTGSNLGSSALPWDDIFVADEIEHGGDPNTRIQFFPDEIWFYAGRTTTMLKLSEVGVDFVQISGGGEDTDFLYSSTVASNAFFCDDGNEECTFAIAMGFESNAGGMLTMTLDGGTALAPLTNNFILLCTGAETLATITGAPPGAIYTFTHFDSDCTITDDSDNSANSIDLVGAADLVGIDDMILSIMFDGTSWNEVSRSQN